MSHLPPRSDDYGWPELFIPDDDEALSREITRLAGHINAAEYRFLKLLAALIERGAWGGGNGIRSPAHWLNYYCSIALGAAREKVRVARCLGGLPRIEAAFGRGEISYSKVRAMTRSATAENEKFLLQIAQYGTAQHLEKLVRRFEHTKRLRDPERDRRQYEAREFTWHYDDDGMLVFRGRLPVEDGAAFLQALNAMISRMHRRDETADGEKRANGQREIMAEADAFPRKRGDADDANGETVGAGEEHEAVNPAPASEGVSAETSQVAADEAEPTFPQKRADALVALADQAWRNLDDGRKPATPADRHQVIVHLERDRLNAGLGHDAALECDDTRVRLSPSAVRRLACDTSLLTVGEDGEGNILDIGRKTRAVPPAMRRALVLRDSTCRFPGCCESRFVDAHHIQHWCDGGETRLDNLILLCRHHHRLVHQEGYGITRRPEGGFEFRKPDGRVMPPTFYPQFDHGDQNDRLTIEAENESVGLAIGARTAVTGWTGEPLDYNLAVGVLMDLEGISPRVATAD